MSMLNNATTSRNSVILQGVHEPKGENLPASSSRRTNVCTGNSHEDGQIDNQADKEIFDNKRKKATRQKVMAENDKFTGVDILLSLRHQRG